MKWIIMIDLSFMGCLLLTIKFKFFRLSFETAVSGSFVCLDRKEAKKFPYFFQKIFLTKNINPRRISPPRENGQLVFFEPIKAGSKTGS